jgi:hypothetical protein
MCAVCAAYYGDTLVGASSSRVEPISDSEDEDDESEERPGEAEIQKHKMANYYVMTLGVLGPYRRCAHAHTQHTDTPSPNFA